MLRTRLIKNKTRVLEQPPYRLGHYVGIITGTEVRRSYFKVTQSLRLGISGRVLLDYNKVLGYIQLELYKVFFRDLSW